MSRQPNESILYINSVIDRLPTDDLNSNEFTVYLSQPIRTYGANIKIRLEQLEIPNVWYSFPIYDSKIWFLENPETTPVLRSINIATDRIFSNGTDFASHLSSQFMIAGYNISFSYSTNTGKLTLTNNHTTPIRLVSSYRFNQDSFTTQTASDANDRIGFNQNYSSTVINIGSSLTAAGVLRLLRTNCCYIECDLADGGANKSSFVPSPYKTGSNIIGRAACSNFGFVSQLQYTSNIDFPLSEKSISSLTFRLLDDQLEPLSTNGSPITFSLVVSYY